MYMCLPACSRNTTLAHSMFVVAKHTCKLSTCICELAKLMIICELAKLMIICELAKLMIICELAKLMIICELAKLMIIFFFVFLSKWNNSQTMLLETLIFAQISSIGACYVPFTIHNIFARLNIRLSTKALIEKDAIVFRLAHVVLSSSMCSRQVLGVVGHDSIITYVVAFALVILCHSKKLVEQVFMI